MKYAVLVGDGMADRPLESLGGRTPLQVARTPWLDKMAREGVLGLVRTIPEGFSPGSDVANLVILGYDPALHYTGRGPLEAASMGVELGPDDVAFRCNLVHLSLEEKSPKMVDFTAGHVRTQEARSIISTLQRELGGEEIQFHPGVSYRHLMVWKGGPHTMRTTAPHDISGQEVAPHLPRGEGAERLIHWICLSQELLGQDSLKGLISPENEYPPNSIWPWGHGLAPTLEPIAGRLGLKGAMITAVDLLKGLGRYAGFSVLDVPGATGYFDTDYGAKGRYALRALEEGAELVFVHVEAPDEAGHTGSVEEKIRAIERFDEEVVGRVLQGIKRWERWAVLALPDHATPLSLRTHSSEPVPFATLSFRKEGMGGAGFHEAEARRIWSSPLDGREILERFVRGSW